MSVAAVSVFQRGSDSALVSPPSLSAADVTQSPRRRWFTLSRFFSSSRSSPMLTAIHLEYVIGTRLPRIVAALSYLAADVPQVDRFVFFDWHHVGFRPTAESGRAPGHLSFETSCSFTVQVPAQLDLLCNFMRRANHSTGPDSAAHHEANRRYSSASDPITNCRGVEDHFHRIGFSRSPLRGSLVPAKFHCTVLVDEWSILPLKGVLGGFSDFDVTVDFTIVRESLGG